jgi:hypothetical protein
VLDPPYVCIPEADDARVLAIIDAAARQFDAIAFTAWDPRGLST